MKAMVLAAGLGTRLRPLTNDRPKALVEISGRTLLEITLARLREFGIREVIVNAHHFADMLASYLDDHQNFGMHIEISREDELLDTGGGLKKAAYFFRGSSEPFILHNVDVLSDICFRDMLDFHHQHHALATIAVQDRKTSRYLLFDDAMQLCGRKIEKNGSVEMARPAPHLTPLAFCGIHIISPRFLDSMTEQGAFSIVQSYLRLASTGEKIIGFRADERYWRDLGTADNVQQAGADMRNGHVRV
jgi:NDP-sugar pyrophosphorylase family protein